MPAEQIVNVKISFRTAFKGGLGFTCGILAAVPLLGLIAGLAAVAIEALAQRQIVTPSRALEAYGFEAAFGVIVIGLLALWLARK